MIFTCALVLCLAFNHIDSLCYLVRINETTVLFQLGVGTLRYFFRLDSTTLHEYSEEEGNGGRGKGNKINEGTNNKQVNKTRALPDLWLPV